MFSFSHGCESSFHLIFLSLKNMQQIVKEQTLFLMIFLLFMSFDIFLSSGAQYDV